MPDLLAVSAVVAWWLGVQALFSVGDWLDKNSPLVPLAVTGVILVAIFVWSALTVEIGTLLGIFN
jgi:hypothetical protein